MQAQKTRVEEERRLHRKTSVEKRRACEYMTVGVGMMMMGMGCG